MNDRIEYAEIFLDRIKIAMKAKPECAGSSQLFIYTNEYEVVVAALRFGIAELQRLSMLE